MIYVRIFSVYPFSLMNFLVLLTVNFSDGDKDAYCVCTHYLLV